MSIRDVELLSEGRRVTLKADGKSYSESIRLQIVRLLMKNNQIDTRQKLYNYGTYIKELENGLDVTVFLGNKFWKVIEITEEGNYVLLQTYSPISDKHDFVFNDYNSIIYTGQYKQNALVDNNNERNNFYFLNVAKSWQELEEELLEELQEDWIVKQSLDYTPAIPGYIKPRFSTPADSTHVVIPISYGDYENYFDFFNEIINDLTEHTNNPGRFLITHSPYDLQEHKETFDDFGNVVIEVNRSCNNLACVMLNNNLVEGYYYERQGYVDPIWGYVKNPYVAPHQPINDVKNLFCYKVPIAAALNDEGVIDTTNSYLRADVKYGGIQREGGLLLHKLILSKEAMVHFIVQEHTTGGEENG